MDDQVTFIGTFRIPSMDEWRPAIRRMTTFVEENVPRILSFNAYASADGSEGTVLYVHPDADSLEQHLTAAAGQIEAGSAMVQVMRIELLGRPNPETVERLRAGDTPVAVKHHVIGFTR